jgi:uncharacterized membrane protein
MPAAPSTYSFRAGPWAIVLGACLAVLALALAPPFVGQRVGAALAEGFRLVCHQLPDRSFALGGVPLALCHRCLGIVAGLVVGTALVAVIGGRRVALVPLERPALLVALTLAGADWLLGVSGVWTNSPLSRFFTGVGVGFVAGYLLARAVAAPGDSPAAAPEMGEDPHVRPVSTPAP